MKEIKNIEVNMKVLKDSMTLRELTIFNEIVVNLRKSNKYIDTSTSALEENVVDLLSFGFYSFLRDNLNIVNEISKNYIK